MRKKNIESNGNWIFNREVTIKICKDVYGFEDDSKLRKFINEDHKVIKYNGEYYKVHRNKSSKLSQLKCTIEYMPLRELNLELIGI